MFCENIHHICQSHCNSLNTNNIKTDRHTPKREYIPVHLPVYLPYSPAQPEHHSTTTETSFHRNRNIIPPQPEHHFSTTGATFSRHKH